MRYFNQGRFRQQVRFLQHQFLQDGNLPFSDILSTELIQQALTALQVGLVDCVYTPLVTLCVFLGQVLSADHSCRAAVARLIAYRVARKERACSPETGAYCQARKRLPEEFFSQIARQTGVSSMPTRNRVGCGRIDGCTFSTAPPSRCPTPTRINKPIPSRRSKNPGWDFR